MDQGHSRTREGKGLWGESLSNPVLKRPSLLDRTPDRGRDLRRLAGPLVAGWAGATFLAALAGVGIGWLYTHPPRRYTPSGKLLDKLDIDYQPVRIVTRDGLELAGWYTPSRNNAFILVCHGWGTCRLEPYHALFAHRGYGVLSFDFRCHGLSQGKNCTCGYYESRDIEAALEFIQRQAPGCYIGFWGGSMGGTAGLRVAKDQPEIEAMVLDSVPSDLRHTAKKIAKFYLVRRFMRWTAESVTGTQMTDFHTLEWLRSYAPRPVLIIHGSADNRLSDHCGQALLEAGGENATLWYVPGSRHLCLFDEQPKAYERRVVGFFDRHLLPPAVQTEVSPVKVLHESNL